MTPIQRNVVAVFSFFLGLGLTLSGLAFAEGVGAMAELQTCTGKSNLTVKPDDATMAVMNAPSPLPKSDVAN